MTADQMFEAEQWVRRLEVFWGPKQAAEPHELNLVRDTWIRNRVVYYSVLPNGFEVLKVTVEALETALADSVFKRDK